MTTATKRSFPFARVATEHPPKKRKTNFNVRGDKQNLPTMSVHGINVNPGQQKKVASNKEHVPLAERMRPLSLSDYVGQTKAVGPNTVLRNLLEKGQVPSMILWGPPGCGKTSLATIITRLSKETHKDQIHVINLSAVSCGINAIRESVNAAKNESKFGRKTIVLMDEIHRFNKLQQDIFLPHVEAGTFTLIGVTTENPSYSLNSALLSRCRVFALHKLTVADVSKILSNTIESIGGTLRNESFGTRFKFIIDRETVEWLAEVCDGDARVALSGLEVAVQTKVSNKGNFVGEKVPAISLNDIKESLKQTHMLSDSQTTQSHHVYSALHKSITAGHENASLYWLARIMAAKEDPVNIARRLVRISCEDVGLADEDALGIAVHTMHGCQMIGMPESDVMLAQCVVYLARAPKSRLVYDALKAAERLITNHEGPQPSIPLHIRCRSGEGKLRASLGAWRDNLLRKEDNNKSCLPLGLEHINFYEKNV